MLKIFVAGIDHRIALRVPDYCVEAKHLNHHCSREPTMLRFELSEILLQEILERPHAPCLLSDEKLLTIVVNVEHIVCHIQDIRLRKYAYGQ